MIIMALGPIGNDLSLFSSFMARCRLKKLNAVDGYLSSSILTFMDVGYYRFQGGIKSAYQLECPIRWF